MARNSSHAHISRENSRNPKIPLTSPSLSRCNSRRLPPAHAHGHGRRPAGCPATGARVPWPLMLRARPLRVRGERRWPRRHSSAGAVPACRCAGRSAPAAGLMATRGCCTCCTRPPHACASLCAVVVWARHAPRVAVRASPPCPIVSDA